MPRRSSGRTAPSTTQRTERPMSAIVSSTKTVLCISKAMSSALRGWDEALLGPDLNKHYIQQKTRAFGSGFL